MSRGPSLFKFYSLTTFNILKGNEMINKRHISLQILIVIFLAAIFTSCSAVNTDSPLSLVGPDGKHLAGWITAHGQYAAPDGSMCTDCHGSDLAGGISGVSCSVDIYNGQSCHGSAGPAFHPADWLDSSLTGEDWHGGAYLAGSPVNGLDCVDCHDPIGVAWPDGGDCVVCHFTPTGDRSPGVWSHADNHSQWAGSPEEAVCIACHDINISFGNQTFCHNCHGAGGIHQDPDWAQRAQHGVTAKQDPGTMTGFGTCAVCHGSSFNGGTSGVSCLNASGCHQVLAPHPDGSSWRGESTPTHTNTDRDNAPACALCHQKSPGTPGCYNNTLCHGNED